MEAICDKESNESPKVWTELTANGAEVTKDVEQTLDSMSTNIVTQMEGTETLEMYNREAVTPLHCLESGDGTDYTVMAVLQSDGTKRAYCPSMESRELHNHKERLRRSRMKCSCDALRALVPGLTDKTDKATVLEHTVAFLFHLSKCDGVKCDDYLPTYPPPMSAKLLQMYPTLMSGEYQYYESIPTTDPDFVSNESHIVEVRETNGTQYVVTSDGSEYMVVQNGDPNTEGHQNTELSALETPLEPIETKPEIEDKPEITAEMSVDPVPEGKENIDPKDLQTNKPIRKKRAYRKTRR